MQKILMMQTVVKNPPKASVQVVKLGNVNASKIVLEPGWKWSEVLNLQSEEIVAKRVMLVLLFQAI